jgi:ABC-type uncharacterized transport system fused permease/ATPase subunit
VSQRFDAHRWRRLRTIAGPYWTGEERWRAGGLLVVLFALLVGQTLFNVFQYAFSFMTLVLPSAIIANRVLSGELEVGHAVQAGGAFTAILAALTVVVDHFEQLSRLSAGSVDGRAGPRRAAGARGAGVPAAAALMPIGDLCCQILYPGRDTARTRVFDDAALQSVLESVILGDLAERAGGLSAVHDWGKRPSVGEQQRLAFARVLVARPRYAILDEATSAPDAANEIRLYEALAQAGITPISVSHRPGLLRFHARVLELPGDASWRTVPASGYRFGS